MRRRPREIRIVYGDSEAKEVLARKLGEICPDADIRVPDASREKRLLFREIQKT